VDPVCRLARSPFALLLPLLAITLLLESCGEQEDVSPNFEDRIPLGVELSAADRVVEWGQGTTLEGRLTQGGEAVAAEAVVLEEDPYPFRGDFAELEEADTDEEGGFSFEVEPDANTSYRVAAGELSEATSPERIVYVEPRTEVKSEPVAGGARFITTFKHAEDRSIQGSSLFSYAAAVVDVDRTGELNFIRVDRIEQLRPGVSEASIELPFPATGVVYDSCVAFTGDSGLGKPSTRCSQSSIPAD
jgi:hypothetical protein